MELLKAADTKMSQDSIRVYKLESAVGTTGGVGNVRLFGDQWTLPTNERYFVYGITTISDYYANIPRSMVERLRRGWVSVTEIYNLARSTTTIMTKSGLIVPSSNCYMLILHNGLLVLAVKAMPDVTTCVYIHSYTNRWLLLDHHSVQRTSIYYINLTQVPEVTPVGMDTLIVNGYMHPLVPPTYNQGDYIDLIHDEHVCGWGTMCLRKCGTTTINGIIHTIVKLHNVDTILSYNDTEMYLCTGRAKICDDGCGSTIDDYGVLVMDINNDFQTLTHQYVAISNRALKKAHALLRKHPLYQNGDVYLRWTIKERPDSAIVNKHHMRVLGDLNYKDAIRVISNDRNVFPMWKAQTLMNNAMSRWLNGHTVPTEDFITELGHIGLVSLTNNTMSYGEAKVGVHMPQYVVVKYQNDLVEAYVENQVRAYTHPHFELISGYVGDEATCGYFNYTGQTVDKDTRVYTNDSGVLVDITDSSNRILIENGMIVPQSGYPSPLYIRSLNSILLYETEFETEEYVTDRVTLEHSQCLNAHVMVWLNGRSLINGLDFVYNPKNGDIYVYNVDYDPELSHQAIVVLAKPTINGVTAMTNVGICADTNKFDIIRLDKSDEIIITANGTRNTRVNANLTTGTFYGAEYPCVNFTTYTKEDLLASQHAVDTAVDDWATARHTDGVYTLISPFMNRVLHVALGSSDDVLRRVHTYQEIHSFLNDYIYMLEQEPRVLIDEHLFKHVVLVAHPAHEVELTSEEYDFIVRISHHYTIELNLANFTIRSNT